MDFAPPRSPSLDQQRDALQKGLGRAMQWARAGRLIDEVLLEACLHDQRYDIQCEGNRGKWLWDLLNATGTIKRFRQPLLDAMRHLSEERDAYQLCQLAMRYGKTGDDEFKDQLYDFVERRPFAHIYPSIGEEELIELGGEKAFLFIARIRGRLLESRDWEWDDRTVVEHAIEQLGQERVSSLVENSSDEAIRRFAAVWRQNPSQATEWYRQSGVKPVEVIPVSQIIEASQTGKTAASFRLWGIYADEKDLKTVLDHLWAARDPNTVAKLLRVFLKRPLPRFDARLIDLCRHENSDVRRLALNALEQNEHPLVREFALAELENQTLDWSVVGFFIRNFIKGDEKQLLDYVQRFEDACQRHGRLMDLLELLEENPEADCSQLALFAYACTPCQNCRFRAAKMLAKKGIAPAWLIEECQYDSFQEAHALVDTKPVESERLPTEN